MNIIVINSKQCLDEVLLCKFLPAGIYTDEDICDILLSRLGIDAKSWKCIN